MKGFLKPFMWIDYSLLHVVNNVDEFMSIVLFVFKKGSCKTSFLLLMITFPFQQNADWNEDLCC